MSRLYQDHTLLFIPTALEEESIQLSPLISAVGFSLATQLSLYTPLTLRRLDPLPYSGPVLKSLNWETTTNFYQEIAAQQGSPLLLIAAGAQDPKRRGQFQIKLYLQDMRKNRQTFEKNWIVVPEKMKENRWFSDCQQLVLSLGEAITHNLLKKSPTFWVARVFETPAIQSIEQLKQLLAADRLPTTPEHVPEKIQMYTELLESDPSHEIAHAHLGNLYLMQQEYHSALAHYKKAVSTSYAINSLRAEYYDKAATCAALVGQQDQAKRYWESAMDIFPNWINPYLSLAHQLEANQALEEAETLLLRAQQLNPEDIRSAFSLARIYSKLDIWPNALIQYQRQLQANPDDPWCYNNIGTCYLKLSRHREALIHFRKAAQIDGNGEAGNYGAFVAEQIEATALGSKPT